MTSPRILLLDHDASRGQRLCDELVGAGCVVALQTDEEGGVRAVEQGWLPDLVFCDGDAGGIDAARVLSRLHHLRPGLPVLVMARHGSVQAAVQALQGGAADYLNAPLELSQALAKIRQFVPAAASLAAPKPVPNLAPAPAAAPRVKPTPQGEGELVAESAAMQQILGIARKAAGRTD